MTLLEALNDRKLFQPHFPGDSWDRWKSILPAIEQSRESYLILGRGSGKSRIGSTLAVARSCFADYRNLAPGQVVTSMILSGDRRQAREDFLYCEGLVDSVPMLRRMVTNRTKESLEFSNRTRIEIMTSRYAKVRGYSIGFCFCDEIAFWPQDESANPDVEVITALKPGLARIPNSLLVCASSPYARRGVMWTAFQRHFGKQNGRIFVHQAPTLEMNPTFDVNEIESLQEEDPQRAAAEYGAQFRSDIESFISREAVEAAVVTGRFELPSQPRVNYHAFCDPSGGRGDSFTLGIAHFLGETAILDACREVRPPFSPLSVIEEYCGLLKVYGCRKVSGDAFGAEFVVTCFAKHGIQYVKSEKTRSEIYLTLLPLLNSGRVQLLDLPRLIGQLASLERRTRASGHDTIDHPPAGHDDVANAAAGACIAAAAAGEVPDLTQSPLWTGKQRFNPEARPVSRAALPWEEESPQRLPRHTFGNPFIPRKH